MREFVCLQAEQVVHHGGEPELEGAVKHNGDHLGIQLHHLNQKSHLLALVGQPPRQHIVLL